MGRARVPRVGHVVTTDAATRAPEADAGRGLADLLSSAGRHRLAGRALLRPVRTILVVYVVSRLVGVVAFWVAATWFQNPAGVGKLDPNPGDLVGLWDSVWYERIADDGYPVPLPADPDTGRLTYSAWAFYPLFPLLCRALMFLGLPFDSPT